MRRQKQARSFADSQLSICNPLKLGKLWKSFSCLMGIFYAKLPLNVTRDSSAGSCQQAGDEREEDENDPVWLKDKAEPENFHWRCHPVTSCYGTLHYD